QRQRLRAPVPVEPSAAKIQPIPVGGIPRTFRDENRACAFESCDAFLLNGQMLPTFVGIHRKALPSQTSSSLRRRSAAMVIAAPPPMTAATINSQPHQGSIASKST